LKPANVFVERDGQLRVLDFGVAKLQVDASSDHERITHEGTLVGSPSYMAPEQIRDAREVDLRADLWSLGVTLYECLTGICPFRGAHVAGTLAAISADAPSPLPRTVSRPLAAIIDRCLQKDPNARFASADALLRALEAQPDARVAAPAKRLVAAAVGFAIVGFAGLALWAGKGERMSATPAQRTSAASDIRTEPLHVATRAAPTPVGAPSPSPAVTVTGQAHHPRGAQPATASTTTAEPPHSAATMPSTPRDIRSAIGERH
jgi:serine/threonine-protein kinase